MDTPRVRPGTAPAEGDGHVSPVESKGDRLQRIEMALQRVQETLDVQFKRIAAMQAEIDLLRMKQKGG